MSPFFSIIIPAYNRAHLISGAIESVLSQQFQDWELLIVDDGSTDNTKEVVDQFNDERIRYIYQENEERSAARNNGIQNALGEWICFLDSDDNYLPNHLTVLHQEIIRQENAIGLFLTGHLITKNGMVEKHPSLNTTENICKEIWSKFILMNAVCVHSSILANNSFNVKYRIWEDTHLWLRIAAQYPVFQINEYTCNQNVTDDSSVKIGFEKVKIEHVKQYIHAITDLKINYEALFKGKLDMVDFNHYIDLKYRMYLYQARQNKHLRVSVQIWGKAMWHQPSLFLLSEFPKIFLNQLNIGIHER